MKKTLISIAAASAAVMSAAVAEECELKAETPAMPDPEEATAEERAAKISEIKAFQSELNDYRECLTATYENGELDMEVRQEALDAFNATIKQETKLVESWQAFDKEFAEANS